MTDHREITKSMMATPGSMQHLRQITASKVPTILGLNPFQTASELWMEMSGLAEPEKLTGEHLDFGHDVEDGLVNAWKRRHPGWQTGRGEVAYTDEALPFPNQVTLDRRARRGSKFRIIECKTTSSFKSWGEMGEALPAHVEAQVMAQMGISGIHTADVVALVGYDKPLAPRHYEVEWRPDIWDGIVPILADFYASLGNAEPPIPPAGLIEELTAHATEMREGDVEFEPEDFAEFDRLNARLAQVEAEVEAEKRRLITKAGGVKRVLVGGKTRLSWRKGRFSQERVPKEAKHLLRHPDVQTTTTKFDAKKFAEKYPDIAKAACGEPTPTFK